MDPYIGEIRIFAGNFAPRGWALCNGQLLSIAQNTALFSLLGVMYGGDGRVTFALPDLRGRAPMHFGQGPGLTPRTEGEMGGEETVTLISNQMPSHSHQVNGNQGPGSSPTPDSNYWAASSRRDVAYANNANTQLSPQAVGFTGNNQPHENRQPYLTLNYIIALQGVFPPRS
jgi:microcystin-dependent protein